jgi:hypothetical protein
MKTIKEAAAAYAAQEERVTRSEHIAFVAGVEFAQRWISVEEELPEHTMEVCGDDEYAHLRLPVLVKTDKAIYMTARRTRHFGTWSWPVSANGEVTHWRHIELK